MQRCQKSKFKSNGYVTSQKQPPEYLVSLSKKQDIVVVKEIEADIILPLYTMQGEI